MQLLTASGRQRHTTSVLAPTHQNTNCIAVARRLFSFSQNELFLLPEALRVLSSFSAPLGMLVLSTKCSSSSLLTLCAQFQHFLWNFCYACVCLVQVHKNKLHIKRVSSYVCVFVPVGHCTLLSGLQVQCSVLFPVVRNHFTGTA